MLLLLLLLFFYLEIVEHAYHWKKRYRMKVPVKVNVLDKNAGKGKCLR